MKGYLVYLLTRLGQFALVVFIGINIAFIVTHATPIDPVEQSIAAATQYGSTSPEAIALMRQSLKELYGLEGGLVDQYLAFWRRVAVGNFGPSLSAFPTPVAVLIGRALPWTAALLTISTLLTWVLGNLLGGLAGYYRRNRALRLAGVLAMAFHPIPDSVVGAGRAGRLVHGHALAGLQHRHRGLRRLCRAGRRRASSYPRLLRHAQRPGAAGHRSRHVARRHLQWRHHHRAGVRLSRRRHAPGVGRLCRRLQPRAGHHHGVDRGRLACSAADRPFISAARSPGQGALTMGRTVLHLLRFNRQFATGVVLLAVVAGFSGLSFFSPYPPNDSFVVPPDVPPSWDYPMGTTSRGQDLFWLLSFAIRNTLLFGIVVAVLSRILALAIGLVAGYSGGLLDRALMSLNDTFIVIPLFPILVLFYFVMREHMSWGLLALMMACLGWAYDARLIRSVAMSLRTREFTETGIFSGMSTRQILVEEHLPYVLPIVFSTTMNNINWSIGLEVTLSVLGFTDINRPTIGMMIYWANQHTALVAGIWWWIFFPVLLVVATFIGLFLLAISMNEHIDPRSRLGRTGG